MIQMIAETTKIIDHVRTLNLSEQNFKQTIAGCIFSINRSDTLTDQEKATVIQILSMAVK